MDLAQKANRVKRELQAAVHKPEDTSIRHAVDAFDAFVDGVVEEIAQLKAAMKSGEPGADASGSEPAGIEAHPGADSAMDEKTVEQQAG